LEKIMNQSSSVLTENKKIEMLETLILIRRFEERVKELYNGKKIEGAIHLCIGQEAVPVGICAALDDRDFVFSTHRGHGHAIAKSGDLHGIMAELMGRDTGLSRGHGGSMHLFHLEKGLMGGNGIVGGGIPLSLGAAFKAQYSGTDQVSVCFFSDGASNQGSFGESLNLAALWKLPVLFICENNHYAATTPFDLSIASADLAERARGYGLNAEAVDGNDVFEVYEKAAEAVDFIRGGNGPRFIECKTYRIEPHCGIIPDQRRGGERETWAERDPIRICSDRLLEEGILSEQDSLKLDGKAAEKIDEAVSHAEGSPWPDKNAEHNRTWSICGECDA
jgi:TPP-dependent pyruvate/acetoin dehydrogenase alpha subunit